MKSTKIVFLGAGSTSFGLSMFRDLFTTQEIAGSTLCLVDTNPENLERMTRLAILLNQVCQTNYTIEATANRRSAFAGAEYVVNSVAIDRNRLWKLDFNVPKKYGIRHTLGENGGPRFATDRPEKTCIPFYVIRKRRLIPPLCRSPVAYFAHSVNG